MFDSVSVDSTLLLKSWFLAIWNRYFRAAVFAAQAKTRLRDLLIARSPTGGARIFVNTCDCE